MKNFWIIFILITCSIKSIEPSLINDFFSGAKNLWPRPMRDVSNMNQLKDLPQVRFEIPKESEQFLKQGMDLIKAPPEDLDLCSHRVILTLNKNCNQMGTEEISKLAVMLMNCQLEAEGRSIYPCTPEMTLAQCTMGFENEIYQLYNIVLQRALSMCAAIKQQQLRMFTELAVNRLLQITQKQTSSMHEALQNQKRINEMGIQNMQEYRDNFDKIKDTQIQSIEFLGSAKDQMIELNSDLHRQLEMHQISEQKLIAIEKTAEKINQQLETTNEKILQHYNEAITFMEHFKTIMQMIAVITSSIERVFEKIKDILDEVGLDINQDTAITLALNLIYFMCGMIFILFVNLQRKYKRVLIILFLLNNIVALSKADISLLAINILIWLSLCCFNFSKILKEKLFDWSLRICNFFKFGKKNGNETDRRSPSRARSKTPFSPKSSKSKNNSNKKNLDVPDDEDSEIADICEQEIAKIESTTSNMTARSETPMGRPMTPAVIRVMAAEGIDTSNRNLATPFRPGTSGRIQCQAYTNLGAQCRNAALVGYEKCRVHNYN